MFQLKQAGEDRDEVGWIVALFKSLNQTYLPIISQLQIKGNITFLEAVVQIDLESARSKALFKDMHEISDPFVNKVSITAKSLLVEEGL